MLTARQRLRLTPVLFVLLSLSLLWPPAAHAFTNGDAPASAMSPVSTGVRCTPLQGQLANDAAAAWNSMSLAAGKRLPTNGCDSAYRPLARQVYWRDYWCALGQCGNAAVPGTSNHGLGLAADVPQWVRGYIDLHGQRFGWCKCWSDAPSEWWHLKWADVYHRPNPGTSLAMPRLMRGSGGPGQGPWVRKVQRLLRRHGDRSVTADGDFGKLTARAVRRFQLAEEIKVTGVVNKQTWRRLRAPVVVPTPTPPPPTPAPTPQPSPSDPGRSRTLRGVDVSQHQGDVNWDDVRAAGYAFAVAKASEGQDFTDPGFSRGRLDAIKAAGLVPGVYHYLRPRADRKGSREAFWFLQVIQQAGYGRGFLRPVADVEETSIGDAALCDYVLSFARAVKRQLGVGPIIYTYPSFAGDHLGRCRPLRQYPLWIASYGVDHPAAPVPWTSWVAHQWTSDGHVIGIGTSVDLNRMPGGRRAVNHLRVDSLPQRLRRRVPVPVAQPLAAEPLPVLRAEVPAADARPLAEVPAPRGDEVAPVSPADLRALEILNAAAKITDLLAP